jgi:hypothetical protein
MQAINYINRQAVDFSELVASSEEQIIDTVLEQWTLIFLLCFDQ